MAYSSPENHLTEPNLDDRLNEGVNHPDEYYFNCNSASRDLSRSKRKFVSNDSKDCDYWQKRLKNNNAARKSRWKRKSLESYMEKRLTILMEENQKLRLELKNLRDADVYVGITNIQSHNNSPPHRHSGKPTQLEQIKNEATVKSLKPKSDMCIPLKFRHKNQVHSIFNRD